MLGLLYILTHCALNMEKIAQLVITTIVWKSLVSRPRRKIYYCKHKNCVMRKHHQMKPDLKTLNNPRSISAVQFIPINLILKSILCSLEKIMMVCTNIIYVTVFCSFQITLKGTLAVLLFSEQLYCFFLFFYFKMTKLSGRVA